jgi:predicted RNase H-like nuclease (RuvC/YqgF family)
MRSQPNNIATPPLPKTTYTKTPSYTSRDGSMKSITKPQSLSTKEIATHPKAQVTKSAWLAYLSTSDYDQCTKAISEFQETSDLQHALKSSINRLIKLDNPHKNSAQSLTSDSNFDSKNDFKTKMGQNLGDSQETKDLKGQLVEFYGKNQSLLTDKEQFQEVYRLERDRNFLLESKAENLTREISKSSLDSKKILRLDKKISALDETVSTLRDSNNELESSLVKQKKITAELHEEFRSKLSNQHHHAHLKEILDLKELLETAEEKFDPIFYELKAANLKH